MLSTKAFADLCDTTKKTIIHYDRIGLLKPFKYHLRNRLYLPKQVLLFQKIFLLKSFGLTLCEIKKYLYKDKALLDLFLQKEKQMSEQKISLEKKITKVNEFIENLKKGKTLVDPKIKIIKPYTIYGLEKVGRYVDIKKHQRELFERIGDNTFQQTGLTIFFDPKYSPDNAHMITGALVAEKQLKNIPGVKIIKVPGYKTVSYLHYGQYAYMSYIWQFLDKFVKDNNLKINAQIPCREFYLHGAFKEKDENNLVTELQVPII